MPKKVVKPAGGKFEWLDLTEPDAEELKQLAAQYQLHPALIKDCMQSGHLPKYERMDSYSFIIFRVCAQGNGNSADNVRALTDKISLFYSDTFVLTIHKERPDFFEPLAQFAAGEQCSQPKDLLNALIYACLNTYEQPLDKLSREVDYYEEVVFLRPKKVPLLRGLYYLKRKIDLMRRMLILSFEIIDSVDTEQSNVNTRDTRDEYVKLQHMFDALSENIHQLLNIYFSSSSQKTNEIIRVLTIFSVFFMPLTFIVGVYGMNFKWMPELAWKAGYPLVMLLMALVTLFIYAWFKRKKWL
jgi:magnesium transporter